MRGYCVRCHDCAFNLKHGLCEACFNAYLERKREREEIARRQLEIMDAFKGEKLW